MKRRLSKLRLFVVGILAALLWSACTTIDFNAIDWDGDGVPDQNDAFPVDPNEDTDTDDDGVGDNSDAFPLDPTRSTPDQADEPADNGNDNAAPPDNGNINDNGAPDPLPPSGGRR